jgi:hypothetical protein
VRFDKVTSLGLVCALFGCLGELLVSAQTLMPLPICFMQFLYDFKGYWLKVNPDTAKKFVNTFIIRLFILL